jgi:hypothetical protein
MQQEHHHKNTTHSAHKNGNYTDFNFGMICKREKLRSLQSTKVQQFPPTNFNAPDDGRLGRNMLLKY